LLAELASAEVFWLSTVRPDGRPHVTPLLGAWLGGSFWFCTGPGERKAANIAANPSCAVTTGHNGLVGLDVVIDGVADPVSGRSKRSTVAEGFEVKYGAHFAAPAGTWAGLGDGMRAGEVLVFQVVPRVVLAFAKSDTYSQTTWTFSGPEGSPS
jgi:hypothetical protein